MKPLYTFPRETWDAKKCWRKARYAPKDAWGNKLPKGIIASNTSRYPQYGQTIKYNGGIYIDGVLYEAVHKPLPYIPACYEFYQFPCCGTAIRPTQEKPVKKHITHCKDGKFYGLVRLENGHEYYIGPFNSRSVARRAVLKNDHRKASGYKKETKQ